MPGVGPAFRAGYPAVTCDGFATLDRAITNKGFAPTRKREIPGRPGT